MATHTHVRLVEPAHDPALVDYLAEHRLFGVLPQDALIPLSEQIRSRAYPRGHHLYTDGDPTTHVYVVLARKPLFSKVRPAQFCRARRFFAI